MKTVQETLGHSSLVLTTNTYTSVCSFACPDAVDGVGYGWLVRVLEGSACRR